MMNDDYQSRNRPRRNDYYRWLDEVEDVECFRWDDRGIIRIVEITALTKEEWPELRDIFDGTVGTTFYGVLVPLTEMEVLAAA